MNLRTLLWSLLAPGMMEVKGLMHSNLFTLWQQVIPNRSSAQEGLQKKMTICGLFLAFALVKERQINSFAFAFVMSTLGTHNQQQLPTSHNYKNMRIPRDMSFFHVRTWEANLNIGFLVFACKHFCEDGSLLRTTFLGSSGWMYALKSSWKRMRLAKTCT